MQVERRPAQQGRPPLEIHRSARRRRNAAAQARDGVVVLRLPAGLPRAQEERLVADLVRKITGRLRAEALGGDEALEHRARRLADRYLDGIRPTSVRWSARMARQLGSCTPSTGEIRISRAVAAYPAWVRDYVLLHELVHLRVADHSAAFHELLGRYPWSERARGWLQGHTAGLLAAATPVDGEDPPVGDEPVCQGAEGPGSSSSSGRSEPVCHEAEGPGSSSSSGR